jgi:putative ABC transport system substrate-binding protein
MTHMRRRQFITLLGGAAAWPLAARAQQPILPVIGFLRTTPSAPFAHLMTAFRQGLSEVGFVEGQNIRIEQRWTEGEDNRLPALVADLMRRQAAVIVTNQPGALAAKAAGTTIPIVFASGTDPVNEGLVASLNRPGGNLTGLTQLNIEMEAKRVQVLRELAPAATSIAMLINPTSPAYSEAATESAQSAARVLGVRLLVLNASTPSGIAAAFVTLVEERVGLLLVSGDSFLVAQRDQIVALAARHAVPTLYHRREFTAAGGLMSLGPSLPEAYYLVGDYSGRIVTSAEGIEFRSDKGVRILNFPDQQHANSERKHDVTNQRFRDVIGAMTDDACMAYDKALRDAGRCLASEALQPAHTAATVRVRSGKVSITDGPFAETKELVAGYSIWEVKSMEEAVAWVKRCPLTDDSEVEIRPIFSYSPEEVGEIVSQAK